MKGIFRNSLLAVALTFLTSTAIAQDVPCVDPCGGDGGGEGGSCTNTFEGRVYRFSHIATFRPTYFSYVTKSGNRSE
jgi:hypothetical protein